MHKFKTYIESRCIHGCRHTREDAAGSCSLHRKIRVRRRRGCLVDAASPWRLSLVVHEPVAAQSSCWPLVPRFKASFHAGTQLPPLPPPLSTSNVGQSSPIMIQAVAFGIRLEFE